MRIYPAPHVSAPIIQGTNIDTYINLQLGTYNSVVQAWDNCGSVGKAFVTITVTSEFAPAGFLYTVNSDYGSGNTTNTVQGFTIVEGNGALALHGSTFEK